MIAPVVPSFRPAASASCAVGTLCRQTITASHSISPVGRRHRPHPAVAVADEPLDAGAEAQCHAPLGQRLVDRLGDVGIEQLRQRPRAFVDEVDLQAAVGEVAGHLDADRRAAVDDDPLHGVQFLVELHRRADVLDVVQALEVGARDGRLLPRPAGADRELVEALVGVARGDRPAGEIDVGDRRSPSACRARPRRSGRPSRGTATRTCRSRGRGRTGCRTGNTRCPGTR